MNESIEPMANDIDQQQVAEDLVERARSEGGELAGPDGKRASTWAMTSTTPPAATRRTPATAPVQHGSDRGRHIRGSCCLPGIDLHFPGIAGLVMMVHDRRGSRHERVVTRDEEMPDPAAHGRAHRRRQGRRPLTMLGRAQPPQPRLKRCDLGNGLGTCIPSKEDR